MGHTHTVTTGENIACIRLLNRNFAIKNKNSGIKMKGKDANLHRIAVMNANQFIYNYDNYNEYNVYHPESLFLFVLYYYCCI